MFRLFKSKTKAVRVPLEVLSVLWRTADDMRSDMYPQGKIAGQNQHTGDSHACETDQPGQHTNISYNSREIQDFYKKYIVQSIRGQALNVIIKLLQVLDEKGACPSIVHGDGETPEEYRCLDSITLTEHSLNVARKGFNMLNTGRHIIRNNTTDVLIAALGHDMGKIPGLAQKGVPGHTFSTMAYLRPVLATLESGEKILEAVRLLHAQDEDRKGGNKDLSILQILEEADIQARQAELKAVQVKPAAQSNVCEGPAKRPATLKARHLARETLLQAMKPLLLKDVRQSFMFRDKVFLSPAFVKQVATNLAQGRGNQDFFESCTEKEIVKLIGCTDAVRIFTVRFYKRKAKPVTQQYISLDKRLFGDLSGLKERHKAQGVRKVVCV